MSGSVWGITDVSLKLSVKIRGNHHRYGGQQLEDGSMSLEEMLKVFFAILLAAIGISQARPVSLIA